jgi:hypothetical protein
MYLVPDLLVLPGVLDLDFKGFGRGFFKEACPKEFLKMLPEFEPVSVFQALN